MLQIQYRGAELKLPAGVARASEFTQEELLRFSTCNYIQEHHNNILLGATGSGKTYLACALGMAAARRFYAVKYIRLPDLLVEFQIARSNGTIRKLMAQYKKYPCSLSTNGSCTLIALHCPNSTRAVGLLNPGVPLLNLSGTDAQSRRSRRFREAAYALFAIWDIISWNWVK
jgi:hypothetical protein